jgi:TRAP-type C4-dicarboxylate transport system permease small subunit
MVMRFLMALAMGALVVGGTYQVVARLIGANATFVDEFLRYILIWASMIGSAYCFYRDEHLSLDLVKDRVKGPVAIALTIFIEAAVLFFVIYVFIYGGIRMTVSANNASSVMRIPFKFLYSVMPISGVLIVLGRILKYLDLLFEKKEGKA